MKIHVKYDEGNIRLWLPTNLVFSKGTVWLANRVGRKYAGEAMKEIPPEALDKLFTELRWIKGIHGSWDLVEVKSADGNEVLIQL